MIANQWKPVETRSNRRGDNSEQFSMVEHSYTGFYQENTDGYSIPAKMTDSEEPGSESTELEQCDPLCYGFSVWPWTSSFDCWSSSF